MTAKSSSSNNGKLIGCLAIGAVVLILIVAAAIFFVPGLTSPAKPTTAANVNVVVNLTVPLDDSTVPLNSSTAIQAEGLSTQSVTTLELWVDGALFASKTVPPSGQNQFFASWGWMPTAAGDHTLFVRAGDATHPSVDSNPVHVTASADANSTIAVNYPVKPGDTAQSVAQQFQSTPQQIIDLNPQINPSNPITPGLTISVPLPMPEIPATPISTTLPSASSLPPPPPAGGASAPSAPSSPPSASIKLGNAKLVPTVPMIGVYCYLSVDGAPATRVPATGLIASSLGGFDLTSSLPLLTVSPGQKTITLTFDCWGLSIGPPATVVHLGTATRTINPSQPNAPLTLTGDMFKLDALLPNLSPAVRKILAGLSGPTPFIYPPTNVMDTGDPAVCGSHGGGFLCAAGLASQMLALVWDWPSNSSSTYVDVNHPDKQYDVIKDIDGYRVYETDYFYQHQLVTPTSLGSGVTGTVFNLPPRPALSNRLLLAAGAPTAQRCFVVRAYKGNVESSDSDRRCLNGGPLPGTKTIPLPPDHFTSVDHFHSYTCITGQLADTPFSAGTVGYFHSDPGPCEQQQRAIRTLVHFDLSPVDGPVWRAALVFDLDSGTVRWSSAGGQLQGAFSCASELMLATEPWIYFPPTDFVLADPYLTLEDPNDPNPTVFYLDVTSAVRSWQHNSDNFGFEIRGSNEDTGAEDNLICESVYSNFHLDVEYFPK